MIYRCVNNNIKITFGSGAKLIVLSKEKKNPKYYKLNRDETTACLATDFSAHNATEDDTRYNLKWGEAGRVKGESEYSQVALIDQEDTCNETIALGKTDWPFDTDPKTNFLSLTILGLRILFVKTIIFNVLMTLRLWMS
ncbi:hypothetical protein DPEC_G00063510 [Dallia pectoralis]|uniref:Uncharacterized protein n=1 Tax=Dallia pectoralis TaxID=75939 RepID=A0ACC2H7F6_DALPE|nr:hypothetical protein DPEC_G00063510 [Dallia pectoralis]